MVVHQVSIEITIPAAYKDMEGLRATITYRPHEPGSTHIYLPSSDLNIKQLQIVEDFVHKLTLFSDKAKELMEGIIQ